MSELVDTSNVFKELVHWFTCDEPFYFTLWAIAANQKLGFPHCSTAINLADRAYQALVISVRARVAAISAFQCASPADQDSACERAGDRPGQRADFMSEPGVLIAAPTRGSRHRRGAQSTARDQSIGGSSKSATSEILRFGLEAAK
jgi:hypothetical protein